jgi:16S rRNA (guanine1207-N2)-methyltransferase
MNFDTLRRWPDIESAELQAWDAADALILDEAAAALAGTDVVVIGDTHGALTLGALDAGATSVRVHQDSIVGEQALFANAEGKVGFTNHQLDKSLLEGATVVIMRLPRSKSLCSRAAASSTCRSG